MKVTELKEIIEKVKPVKDSDDESRYVLDLSEQLNKTVSVIADTPKEAKAIALELIKNESDGIRGFSLEDV